MRNSKIPYVHHTFNPWWGCEHQSSGCDNCYAERLGHRFGNWWGKDSKRRFFDDDHWLEPLRWNCQAAKTGVVSRVLCGSMCDVFESRVDLNACRRQLFLLAENTRWLHWLFLTKRPENIRDMVPTQWLYSGMWPRHIWTGTSIENQDVAACRLNEICRVPGFHFLSLEPLIGSVDLLQAIHPDDYAWDEVNEFDDDGEPEELIEECEAECDWINYGNDLVTNPEWIEYQRFRNISARRNMLKREIQWVIIGGETGPKSRPVYDGWVQDVFVLCESLSIPFYFKAWGTHHCGQNLVVDMVAHRLVPDLLLIQ